MLQLMLGENSSKERRCPPRAAFYNICDEFYDEMRAAAREEQQGPSAGGTTESDTDATTNEDSESGSDHLYGPSDPDETTRAQRLEFVGHLEEHQRGLYEFRLDGVPHRGVGGWEAD